MQLNTSTGYSHWRMFLKHMLSFKSCIITIFAVVIVIVTTTVAVSVDLCFSLGYFTSVSTSVHFFKNLSCLFLKQGDAIVLVYLFTYL